MDKCHFYILTNDIKEFKKTLIGGGLTPSDKILLTDFICKEDKNNFLENFYSDLLKEEGPIQVGRLIYLVKICILNNSIKCFDYFYKIYKFKIVIANETYPNCVEVTQSQLETLSIDMLKSFILKLRQSYGDLPIELFCQNIYVIILECLRRNQIENIDKIFEILNFNIRDLVGNASIEILFNFIIQNDAREVVYQIVEKCPILLDKVLRTLVKNEKIDTLFYFIERDFTSLIQQKDIEMSLFLKCIQEHKPIIFEQLYDRLDNTEPYKSKLLVSKLIDECLINVEIDILKYLDDIYNIIPQRPYGSDALTTLLWSSSKTINTHQWVKPLERKENYLTGRRNRYNSVLTLKKIEMFDFLISKGYEVYESHLVFSIMNKLNSLAKHIINGPQGVKDSDGTKGSLYAPVLKKEKYSNTYLLTAIAYNNIEMFYYMIDMKLIENPYDENIYCVMENILFTPSGQLTPIFNSEFISNKEWWMRYFIFASSMSKFRNVVVDYVLDVRNIVKTVSEFPKGSGLWDSALTNIIVEYI